jgi:hypothetical protein
MSVTLRCTLARQGIRALSIAAFLVSATMACTPRGPSKEFTTDAGASVLGSSSSLVEGSDAATEADRLVSSTVASATGNSDAGEEAMASVQTEGGRGDSLKLERSLRGYASIEELCKAFVQQARVDGEEVGKTFSFAQHPARCSDLGALTAFRPQLPFAEAHTIKTTRISRTARQMVVRLGQLWFETAIAWNVEDSENATPMWRSREPDSFVLEGNRLVAYLGGDDVMHNESTEMNRKGAALARYLRGAFVCEASAASLACAKWDPSERAPLGIKERKRGFSAWHTVPWQSPRGISVDLVSPFPSAR